MAEAPPVNHVIARSTTRMNKSDLIEIIAKQSGLSKAMAGKVLDSTTAAITDAVAKGDTVALVGFGTFKQAARGARTGKNPRTGESLTIAATSVPKFSAGAAFKAAVANKG
jgi:DNA-binding protein HU-beta